MKAIKRALLPVFLLWSLCLPAQEDTDISPQLRAALKKSISQSTSFIDRFAAEVWLIDMSGRIQHLVDDELERLSILKAVHLYAKLNDIPVAIVMAVIETESHFDRFAISSAGALGIMQIMPFWKREIGTIHDNLLDTDTNIRYGCAILKHYLKIEKGNMSNALARYNGSRGKLKYPNKVNLNTFKYL